MSVKALTYYTVVCDGCGEDAGRHADHSAWSDESTAREQAEYDDWFTGRGKAKGLDFCSRCTTPQGITDEQDDCAHDGPLTPAGAKVWRCVGCGLRIGPEESTEAGR